MNLPKNRPCKTMYPVPQKKQQTKVPPIFSSPADDSVFSVCSGGAESWVPCDPTESVSQAHAGRGGNTVGPLQRMASGDHGAAIGVSCDWVFVGSCFPQTYADVDSAVLAFARQWDPLAQENPSMQWMALARGVKDGRSKVSRLMMRIFTPGSRLWSPAPKGPHPNVFSRPCAASSICPAFLPEEIQACLTRAPLEDGVRRVYLHLPYSGDVFVMRFCLGFAVPRAFGGRSGEDALTWLRDSIRLGILEICWLQGRVRTCGASSSFVAVSTYDGGELLLCAQEWGQPMWPVDEAFPANNALGGPVVRASHGSAFPLACLS
jgi:hypothetical protein